MHIIHKPKKYKNIICTIAIGDKYFNEWKKFSQRSWKKYCEKYQIMLIVFSKPIRESYSQHTVNWDKLLVGSYLLKKKIFCENICFLDADILINYIDAPDVFKYHKKNTISLVSKTRNLQFKLDEIKRFISFNRRKYFSKKYPLNSAILMNHKEIYLTSNLKPQYDYAATGFYIFNQKKYSEFFKNIFIKYENFKAKIAHEETFTNYELLSKCKINWVDYRFQAIWIYEVAYRYGFLYKFYKNKKIVKSCIEDCLRKNYFLHFAGKWHESQMYKIRDIFNDDYFINNKLLSKYLKKKINVRLAGEINPD